jgi:hypothetical protein
MPSSRIDFFLFGESNKAEMVSLLLCAALVLGSVWSLDGRFVTADQPYSLQTRSDYNVAT